MIRIQYPPQANSPADAGLFFRARTFFMIHFVMLINTQHACQMKHIGAMQLFFPKPESVAS
ncbi:hypothetical protein DBR19_00655 [Aeromonas sp. HMWF014]|nr:hypothetical protein DBR19_00655 [Aeromonas sp. HMWF014]